MTASEEKLVYAVRKFETLNVSQPVLATVNKCARSAHTVHIQLNRRQRILEFWSNALGCLRVLQPHTFPAAAPSPMLCSLTLSARTTTPVEKIIKFRVIRNWRTCWEKLNFS